MKTFIKYILAVILALQACILVLTSCTHEDLGLPVTDSTAAVTQIQEIEQQLSAEELFLQMKTKQDKNPLSNIYVRKAIMHSVDRDRIAEEIFMGYNDVADSLFPADSPFWAPEWAQYDYDLDKAEEYLNKAGYGLDNPLYLTISTFNNSTIRQSIEDIISQDLSKIGINLWVYNKAPKDFYQDYIYNGSFEMGIWSLYIFGDEELTSTFSSEKIPSMETEKNTGCENYYWYSDSNIDDLLTELGITDDVDEAKEIIGQIQKMLADDAFIMPLYSRLFVFASGDKLNKAEVSILGDKVFYNIEDWIISKTVEMLKEEESKIAIGYESDDIDIFNNYKTYSINDLIVRGLWKLDADGSYIPELAEDDSSKITDNVTEMDEYKVAVTLKDDIFWQNGDAITSEDVKYTFEYLMSFADEEEYFLNLDQDYEKIEDIEIKDDKNFYITFNEKVRDWKKLFPLVFKKDSLLKDSYGGIIRSSIVANGPYKLVSYGEGLMVLEKNEYYYGRKPEIDRLEIKFDSDTHNLIAMLKEGEIDFLSIPVEPDLMKSLEDDYDIKLNIKKGNLVEHLALSLKPREE